MNNVQRAIPADSFGGAANLIRYPASMTHSKVLDQGSVKAGIAGGLFRSQLVSGM